MTTNKCECWEEAVSARQAPERTGWRHTQLARRLLLGQTAFQRLRNPPRPSSNPGHRVRGKKKKKGWREQRCECCVENVGAMIRPTYLSEVMSRYLFPSPHTHIHTETGNAGASADSTPLPPPIKIPAVQKVWHETGVKQWWKPSCFCPEWRGSFPHLCVM